MRTTLVGLMAMLAFVAFGVAACHDMPVREAQGVDLMEPQR